MLQLPLLVREIMERISRGGYQCYLVGGSVRDLLMSREPADYDFVTDRQPREILHAAREAGWKAREQGKAFGIIQFIIGEKRFEVASMRTEGYGDDPHRPERVAFVGDLLLDLARRDFTMNAVALDKDGKFIDPFGGMNDIKEGIIRSIGDPGARFWEDPLRVLRAARFAVQMGFSVEGTIPPAMMERKVQKRFKGLSVERVRDEFEKILLAAKPSRGLKLLIEAEVLNLTCSSVREGEKIRIGFLPEIMQLGGVMQNPCYHEYDVLTHTLKTVDEVPAAPLLRWAALLHDIAKGRPGVRTLNRRGEISDRGHHLVGAGMARVILERLKISRKYIRRVVWLVKNHRDLPDTDPQKLSKWAIKISKDFTSRHEFAEAARQLFLLGRADDASKGKKPAAPYFAFLLSQFPKTISHLVLFPGELAISGNDILEAAGSGPIVGRILSDLLADVQKGSIKNIREDLLITLKKKAQTPEQAL